MPPQNSQQQVTEQTVRTFADWTPSMLRQARMQADSGSLRMAADLCEAMQTDDRVKGILPTRTRGLIGLDLSFEAGGGDGRRRRSAIKALEAEEDWWAAYPEEALGQLLDWGTMLGVGLGQQIWEKLPNGREVGRLKIWHPRWLRYDWGRRAWMLTVDGGREIEITPGDGTWILYTPGGAHRPWLHGAWIALGKWWLWKEYAREDWARHSEVHGQPIRVGTAPEGAKVDAKAQLAADLADLGSDTSIVLPVGYEVDLLEAKARTWEMFQAQIELVNVAIAIILAGQNLTTEVQGGSYAAAEVHRFIRGDLIRADGQTLSTCLHDQGVVFWAERNFGDRALAPWPKWDTQPPEDLAALAQIWGSTIASVNAWNTLLAAQNQEVDFDEIARRVRLPVRALNKNGKPS